jgi:ElaB/YqjD/DUF883 family membrane-anchored ribosome-binding protein
MQWKTQNQKLYSENKMATNRDELAAEIEKVFTPTSEVKTKEEATELRKKLAEALADKIDAYVQYQIGLRLEGILTAVGTPSSSTRNVVPLVRGAGFPALIRKT